MLGTFVLETSEGMTELMTALGIGWFQRAIACSLYPYITISQADSGEIGIDRKNKNEVFFLGKPFKGELGDGTEVEAVVTMEGGRMVRRATGVKDGQRLQLQEVKEFTEDGQAMTIIVTWRGKPQIRAVRGFTRSSD